MGRVLVEIDSRWVKIARSPIYVVIAALQGISVSFAPLFLYWSGRGNYPTVAAKMICGSVFEPVIHFTADPFVRSCRRARCRWNHRARRPSPRLGLTSLGNLPNSTPFTPRLPPASV